MWLHVGLGRGRGVTNGLGEAFAPLRLVVRRLTMVSVADIGGDMANKTSVVVMPRGGAKRADDDDGGGREREQPHGDVAWVGDGGLKAARLVHEKYILRYFVSASLPIPLLLCALSCFLGFCFLFVCLASYFSVPRYRGARYSNVGAFTF